MKHFNKFSLALFGCIFLVLSSVAAFPGIKTYLPDYSGQYVYYRDYSFEYEVYIGFLYYDEGTYAMRYYAPQYPGTSAVSRAGTGRSGIPKSIEILFTLNPDVDYTEMTGERFLNNISGTDTDIVNYMHDLVYELSARRRNLKDEIVSSTITNKEDFSQFGGNVIMEYSFDIPIFNLKQITSADGMPLFQIATTGALAFSEDPSFSQFKGFPAPLNDKQRSFTSKKKLPDTEIKYNAQKIKLDNQWMQAAENMYMLGNVALVVLSDFPASAASSGSKMMLDSFCRTFSLSSQDTYADWDSRKVTATKDKVAVEIRYYQPSENSVTRDFKIIKKNKSGDYSVMSLTVFDNAYKTNRSYFDAIVESF